MNETEMKSEQTAVPSDEDTSASLSAKMTPHMGYAAPDLALTERQRAIARAAGMTYREYYTMMCDIPKKK